MKRLFERFIYVLCIGLWIRTLIIYLATGYISRFDTILSICLTITFFAVAMLDTFIKE